MDKTTADRMKHKRVKVRLDTGFFYSGEILEANEDSLLFRDKFGKDLALSYSAITVIEEIE
jgi:hypothetical protein